MKLAALVLALSACTHASDEPRDRPVVAPAPRPAVAPLPPSPAPVPVQTAPRPTPRIQVDPAEPCELESVLYALVTADTPTCPAPAWDGKPGEAAIAHACIAEALAKKAPFAYARRQKGTDSAIGRGFLGRMEGTAYKLYRLGYDSDPCGGGCSENGGTTVSRCSAVTAKANCKDDEDTCFTCVGNGTAANCLRGKPPKQILLAP